VIIDRVCAVAAETELSVMIFDSMKVTVCTWLVRIWQKASDNCKYWYGF